MNGADWRQQEELEEQEWHEMNAIEFVNGQQCRKEGGRLVEENSDSFKRGWKAQKELEDIFPL